MAAYFVDSSALAKRYLVEAGTGWVNSITDPTAGNRVFLVAATTVEVVAAIARRRRSGAINAATAASMMSRFRHELLHHLVDVVDVNEPLIDRAMDIADKHALRGYDSVQLASALEVQLRMLPSGEDLVLVSADAELNAAATAEGLKVDDPNLHP